MNRTKVFCIGFQKTGTTSLGLALEALGFKVCGYHGFRDMADDTDLTMDKLVTRARTLAEEHDAFKDTPWPVLYRQLDEWYPGSKFIHVVRDSDRWIRSACKDFGAHPNMIHRLIYGCDHPLGNEPVWLEKYETHNREVREYFSSRPEDCVSLSLDRGEVGWASVCEFLGLPVPEREWPHANTYVSKKRRMFVQRVMHKLRSL